MPSSASGVQPTAGATFTPASAAASAAASTFGIPTPINTFGTAASSDHQIKFGLGPVATASGGTISSFDAAVPRFGRPVVSAAVAAVAPTPSSSGAAVPSFAASVSAAQGGVGVGGEQQPGVDGTDVAAAAAGVPGPGALMLDVEARRAARWGRE